MSLQLKKAVRGSTPLKIGLSGASGFGKTKSALLLAFGITGDWNKIAVIDSENESASLYANHGDDINIPFTGEFQTIPLHPPYSPERYIEAIKVCEKAGMEVIIVDSITHEWEGSGGCLEIHERLGGQFRHWADVTPRHRNFINAILHSPVHIITTVRRKQEYETTKENGKSSVQKVGTKEITRDGFEYELTLNLELINDRHLAKASKDRIGGYMGRPEFVVSSDLGRELLKWYKSGATALPVNKPKELIEEEAKLEAAIKEVSPVKVEEVKEGNLDVTIEIDLTRLVAIEKVNNVTKNLDLNEVYLSYPELKTDPEFLKVCAAKRAELTPKK